MNAKAYEHMLSTGILISLLMMIVMVCKTHAINSYVYLPDKNLTEEIPIGTIVVDLSDELSLYYRRLATQPPPVSQQYTFLEDVKHASNGNSYFLLDSMTGRVTTKRFLDRETLCLNRHCTDPCDPTYARNMCKINMKVLLVPSYVILSVNVHIQDINDNKPKFRADTMNQSIPENVPVGYRLPIDLAYDPDYGINSIQYYELMIVGFDDDNETFELVQNLNESQLALVVRKPLDRETVPSYHFVIGAYDGGQPALSGNLDVFIDVADVNDNNPKFKQDVFKFSVLENIQVGRDIGEPVQATDPDTGLNGKIRYSIVNIGSNSGSDGQTASGMQTLMAPQQDNYLRYFELDENTGSLRLKQPLDYEAEQFYSLTIEAKDGGIGSLPAYANVEIYVVDVNDNSPDISVSYLNTLQRNFTVDNKIVFIPENMKPNRYIAHVSIFDRDSQDNGKVDWLIMVNNTELPKKADNSGYITVNKLNNNSFTINTGTKTIDRELFTHMDVSILAWDYGQPKAYVHYNFTFHVLDENDNGPTFDQTEYVFEIDENNALLDVVGVVHAHDLDTGNNGQISYSIKEPTMDQVVSIDNGGMLRAQRRFDREEAGKYVFHVVASDNGKPMQTSQVLIRLIIVDRNDNAPMIAYNSTFTNAQQLPDRNVLVLSLDENMPIGTELARFTYVDRDEGHNGLANFYMEQRDVDTTSHTRPRVPFKLTIDGVLLVDNDLDREKSGSFEFTVICQDQSDNKSERQSSEINILVYIRDVNDNCPLSVNATKSAYINKDEYFRGGNNGTVASNALFMPLFRATYVDNDVSGPNADLKFELLTHDDLFEISKAVARVDAAMRSMSQYVAITITFKLKIHAASSMHTQVDRFATQLRLGKYVLRLKISDNGDPMCTINESFVLVIGDNSLNRNGILAQLKTTANNNNRNQMFSLVNDNDNEIILYTNMTSSKSGQQHQQPQVNKSNMKSSSSSTTLNGNDYLLIISLIAIVVIMAIFFTLIGTVYFYSRYKRSLRQKTKLKATRNMETGKLLSANNSCQGDSSETHDGANTEILYQDNRYSFSVKSTESDRSNSADSVSSSAYTKETTCHIDQSTSSSSSATTRPQQHVRSTYKNYTLDSSDHYCQMAPRIIVSKQATGYLDNAHLYSTLNHHPKYLTMSQTREKKSSSKHNSTLHHKYKYNDNHGKNALFTDFDEKSVFVTNKTSKPDMTVPYDYKSSAV